MLYLKYKNLDDLYFNFSRLPFYQEEKYKDKLFNLTNGTITTWMEDVVIEVPSLECSIDMSLLNYTKLKWTTLVNKYIDKNSFEEFKDKLKNSTKKTLSYNFKIHSINKQACLISMVFTRLKHTGPWKSIKVHYRTTEIFKKFSVDLILFNRVLEEVKYCNCEINKLTLFIPLLFFRVDFLAELLGSQYYPLEEFSKIKNKIGKKVMSLYKRYYTKGVKLSNYHTIARKQKLKARADKLPKIPIESLSISESFKKEKK